MVIDVAVYDYFPETNMWTFSPELSMCCARALPTVRESFCSSYREYSTRQEGALCSGLSLDSTAFRISEKNSA